MPSPCHNFSCFCTQSTTEGGRLVDLYIMYMSIDTACVGLNPAVYVSVSVAHVKRTTSTYKGKEDPAWDEEFSL